MWRPNRRFVRRSIICLVVLYLANVVILGNYHKANNGVAIEKSTKITDDQLPLIRQLSMLTGIFGDIQNRLPTYVVLPTMEWTFDNDTDDTFGNFNGELNGAAFVGGGALNVGSPGDFMRTVPFNISSNFTLEIKVTLDSVNTNFMVMGIDRYFTAALGPAPVHIPIYLMIQDKSWQWLGDSSNCQNPFNVTESNVTFHLVVVAQPDQFEDSGTLVRIFRDGAEVYQMCTNETMPDVGALFVGYYNHIGTKRFPSAVAIDFARFYNHALQDSEIELLFTSPNNTTPVTTTDSGAMANATAVLEPTKQQPPGNVAAVVVPSFFSFFLCGFGFYIRKKYQRWRISKEMIVHNVQVLQRLGGGNFGDVYKGIWNGSTIVALKRLKTEEQLEEFRREAVLLYTLKHSKVVQFLGLYSTSMPENYRYIVTEFMALGSASDLIENRPLTQSDKISIARQACAGMICLSTKGVVHRDLALRNIMVTYGNEKDRYIAKVGDMGLAMKLNDSEGAEEAALPIRWAAPECYLKQEFSTASDVWSFGIVLYELFTNGATPYKGLMNKQVIEKVSGGYRLEKPNDCPPEVYRLMRMCWEEDPSKRPSFVQLFEELDRIGREVKLDVLDDSEVPVKSGKDEEPIYNTNDDRKQEEPIYNDVKKEEEPVYNTNDPNDIELQVYN